MQRILYLLAVFFSIITSAMAQAAPTERLVRWVQAQKSAELLSAATSALSQAEEKKTILWLSPLREMKPLRIYRDRVNLVVTLDENTAQELGLYVVLPQSSYLPANDDRWQFTHAKDEIYVFTRSR